MYQAYADIANSNPPSFNAQTTSRVLIQALFEKSSITISTQALGEPCILNINIKPLGPRTMVINRSSPIVSFQDRDRKGLPHGLPQLELRDQEGHLAFTLPLDLFYAEELDTRLRQSDNVSASGFPVSSSQPGGPLLTAT